eukprot:CAMPEP_0206492482 /NCGR_PEP_ID=MMETSP0324_2-20121206/46138_1 /ASSEMBLY_ACC=CAM_ASM_000836 /TAXON_ID=2866 /ORGANISM="Crypthecodinium cohnii, Strain Seligo" /LENGTH=734 /DNA_ID=CAMNT_0053974913 /DNA_START=103 /DNA_END=2304 /DNA_ORIENTATION=+
MVLDAASSSGAQKASNREESKKKADMFEDEEAVSGILKSLISTSGLESSQKGLSKKLQALEKELSEATHALGEAPMTYCSRIEFMELKRNQNLEMEKCTKSVKTMEDTASSIAQMASRDRDTMREMSARMAEIEKWMSHVEPVISGIEDYTKNLQENVDGQLRGSREELANFIQKSDEELDTLKRNSVARLEGFTQDLQATEKRMKEFTLGELYRITDEITGGDEEGESSADGHSEGDASRPGTSNKKQDVMLNFVNKATRPLASDVSKALLGVTALSDEMTRQREEMQRHGRAAEKMLADLTTQLSDTEKSLREEVSLRATKAKTENDQQKVLESLGTVKNENDTLRDQVLRKLNMFRDHFMKLGEVLDDHEHCLRHHAEELENRSSKYDVLLCQHQLDRCARKDDINREISEIRKLLGWQSSKIEALNLTTSGLSAVSPMRRRRAGGKRAGSTSSRLTSARSSALSTPLARGGDVEQELGTDDVVGEGTLNISSPSRKISNISVGRFGALEGENLSLAEVDGEDEDEEDQDDEERDIDHDGQDDGDDDEGGFIIMEEDEPDLGTAALLKKQLEAVAYGLVGLSHLCLREPKLGMGRDARLRQEKDLLIELANLRHWVSTRMLPPGWEPAKLTTVALACSHPRDNELKRPLPQVSLKDLKQSPSAASLARMLQDQGVLGTDSPAAPYPALPLSIVSSNNNPSGGTFGPPTSVRSARAKMAAGSIQRGQSGLSQ